MAGNTQGSYELIPEDSDPFSAVEGGGEGVVTTPPQAPNYPELTEADKIRAHVAWLRANENPVTPLSLELHGLSPSYSDEGWRRDMLDLMVKQGKWSGVGEPPIGGQEVARALPRLVGHTLAMPKDANDLAVDADRSMQELGTLATPDIVGRSMGLAGGLALGGVPFAEEGAFGIFGGRGAMTAPRETLPRAFDMESKGYSPQDILGSSGWYRDVDGQWKHEIDDSKASLHPLLDRNIEEGQSYKLGDALQHPDFFSAYPEAKDWRLGFGAQGGNKGFYDPTAKTIHLNPNLSPEEALSTTLHEAQHGVQELEGFAKGAVPYSLPPDISRAVSQAVPEWDQLNAKAQADGGLSHQDSARWLQLRNLFGKVNDFHSASFGDYQRAAGEVEARNVQTRQEMTPEERRTFLPSQTSDVAPELQNVNFQVKGGPFAGSVGPEIHPDWHPEAGKHISNLLDFYKNYPEGQAGIASVMAGGPKGDVPITDPFYPDFVDAKMKHDKASNPPTPEPGPTLGPSGKKYLNNQAEIETDPAIMEHLYSHADGFNSAKMPELTSSQKSILQQHLGAAQLADEAAKGGAAGFGGTPWGVKAWQHIQDNIANAKLTYNQPMVDSLKKLLQDGPTHTIDPKDKNYWALHDVMSDASDKHLGGEASPVDLSYSRPQAEGVDLNSAVRPLDWQSYSIPSPAVRAAKPEKASALGFNPGVPLLKGLEWHFSPGEGLGPRGGFADPANKPSERAVFATHDPRIANLYAPSEYGEPGYNMTPMLARASKAFEVHWPDISPGNPSYSGDIMQRLIDHVRGQGGDAVVIHNIQDVGGEQTQYAFMHPEQFRAHYAEFDPSKLSSPDLLHLGGVPSGQDSRKKKTHSLVIHLGE